MNKLKVQINDNWNMIFNYIQSSNDPIKWHELVQFCIDYDAYKEFYINLNVWKILVDEKNKIISEMKLESNKNVSIL